MKHTGILISIRPEWCEKIRSGEKKTELRTTAPTLPTPFKAYIYCTKPKRESDSFWIIRKKEDGVNEDRFYGNGNVIGEFVCDGIGEFERLENGNLRDWHLSGADLSCVSYGEASIYIKGKNKGYAWHISELNIYDKPKSLKDFGLSMPPQSWRYVNA